MYTSFLIFPAILGITFFGVELFRRWSLKRDLLDIPNERSSHTTPTPRGGGLIICAVSLTAFLIYGTVSDYLQWTYFAGALIIAGISLVDDLKTVSPFWRILCHGFAAILVIRFVGGFESFWIPFYGIIQTGFLGDLAAFLWIVWLINAYNFMDGIDGIAATQGLTAGIGWSLIGMAFAIDGTWFLGAVLATSSAGFLILNWQPAKIFMGDVGSAFLGYSFAVLPLLASKQSGSREIAALMPWFGALFVWFFLFDSVFTFFRRLSRGEKVWQPHRQHIYQKLVISGLTHAKVTALYGLGSAILVIFSVYFAKSMQIIQTVVFGFVLIETILLILFWLRVVRNPKTESV